MKKPIIFGKYLLLERINVGGMAEVFIAKAFGVEGFERILAIKKILPTMAEDEEFIAMFIDEARISVQLNHTNIVHIHELGKHNNAFYIAMEYVAGRDLRTLLERYRKAKAVMPTLQAVYLAARICEGLDYAHRKKDARGQDLHIIHRDVSPQNILVSYEGEVKIIDFGIAKAANRSQKTQAGILKGKFGYMSPEQVRGMPIDRRSDIFAVGVILYEMLTGQKLFVSESDFSTLDKVRNAEVPLPTVYNPNLPPGLEKVVLRSLAREPEDRYQWASDLQEDLMKFLVSAEGIYSVKNLGSYMKATFAEELLREEEKMERFASVQRPEDLESSAVMSDPPPVAPAEPSAEGTQNIHGKTEPGIPLGNERTIVVAHATPAREMAAVESPGHEEDEDEDEGSLSKSEARAEGNKPRIVIGAAREYTGETVIGTGRRGPPVPDEEDESVADSQMKQFTHLFSADAAEPTSAVPPKKTKGPAKSKTLTPTSHAKPSKPPIPALRLDPRARFWVSGAVALAALIVLTIALIHLSNPPSAGILVRVTPPGPETRVTVGGQAAKNNAVTDVEPNAYEVVASAPGFLAQRRVVSVARGETAVVSVVLEEVGEVAQGSEAENTIPPPVVVPPPETTVRATKESGGDRRVEVIAAPPPRKSETSVSMTSSRRPKREPRVVESAATSAQKEPKHGSSASSKGKLLCSTNPAGAEVWVNGKPTGRQTPVALANPLVLPTGQHQVVFKLGSKQSAPMSVVIKKDEPSKLVNVVVE
jgi:serine/threonine protein kinase